MKNILIASTITAVVTAILLAALLPTSGSAAKEQPNIFKVGNLVSVSAPGVAETRMLPSRVFKIAAIQGDWLHLRLDADRTAERFMGYVLEMSKTFRQSDESSHPEPTKEELEAQKQALMQTPPYSQMFLGIPQNEDVWVNVQAYPGMWSLVE